jgi:hypothetical protein
MSTFSETITLENVKDEMIASHGIIKPENIRKITCPAVVDSGAWTLVIGPEIQTQLGLEKKEDSSSEVAGGEEKKGWMAGPVNIYWKNRRMLIEPFVLPGQTDILLGALPLETMDLMVDMKGEHLVGKHGDKPLYRVM